MFPSPIQNIISNYQILGFLPLDKIMHLLVGALITMLCRWAGLGLKQAFMVLLFICAFKEVIDYPTLGSTFMEALTDTLVTFIYLLVISAVAYFRKKTTNDLNR